MSDLEATRSASNNASLFDRRAAAIGLWFYAALIVTLPTVPYLFSVSPDVASAAAAAGYSNGVAFQLALTILVCCVAVFVVVSRLGLVWPPKQPASHDGCLWKFGAVRISELVAVFFIVSFLYLPWALAETGPFTEDSFFLSVLYRLQMGQRPYIDFEFMYGPLMLFLPHLWLKAFGYSAVSYYGYVAVVEAVKFTLLAAFLQLRFKRFFVRLAAFIVLAPLLFNVLLGPNYDGIRQLLPASILMVIAAKPQSRRAAAAVSLMVGALLSYSHEFGVACLAAIVAVYLLLAWKNGARENLTRLGIMLVFSIVSWLIISGAILGKAFIPYLVTSWNLAQRYQLGELGFPFYWTGNSLAVFGLILLTGIIVGVGIGLKKEEGILAGDLLLLGAFVYNLVSLKSGLNRCDLWHLTTPSFVLALAFVVHWPTRLFPIQKVRRFGWALVPAISVTFLVGLAPASSHVFGNWLHGLKRLATGAAADQVDIESANPIMRKRLSSEAASLRDYLSSAGRDRPVVYYSRIWWLDKVIGVPNAAYVTTSSLTSEASGYRITVFLSQNRNALVVIDRKTYGRVFRITGNEQGPEPDDFYKSSSTKSLASWLSTVHFRVIEEEIIAQDRRWDRTVGTHLRSNYVPVAMSGDLVTLADKTRIP